MKMTNEPSLDDLISLIRETQGISKNKVIDENTLVEDGLGITGDDGCDLLEDIEKQFGFSFVGKDGSLREFFDLEEDQFVFHSEGLDLFGIFSFLTGRKPENVKPITVGDLLKAAQMAKRSLKNG